MMQSQQDYALRVLVEAGAIPDQNLDIGETALALAALDEGPASINAYRDFLNGIVRDIGSLSYTGMPLEEQIGLLAGVMVEHYGFVGDQDNYNDLANANLMRVIDRRRGLPVTLGVLYLHIGRKLGWNMVGLSFPGHFLLRIEANGQRAIIDPFDGCAVREVSDLRKLLKSVQGAEAELMPEHYAPVSDRSVLLRLQNNIKLRRLQKGSLQAAVQTLQTMVLFAPLEAMLWRELGLFQAKLGNLQHAITSLETFMQLGVPESLRHQTAIILQKLKSTLQ
jgi:regulator of sirC expression with transglutaminase-like and TPR domain